LRLKQAHAMLNLFETDCGRPAVSLEEIKEWGTPRRTNNCDQEWISCCPIKRTARHATIQEIGCGDRGLAIIKLGERGFPRRVAIKGHAQQGDCRSPRAGKGGTHHWAAEGICCARYLAVLAVKNWLQYRWLIPVRVTP
jgi:hypothetical protein